MTVLEAYPWVAERFADLREERCGTKVTAECPIKCHRHARMDFSLGLSGCLLLKCWAGCDTLEALRAVGCQWKHCFPNEVVPDGAPRKKTEYPYHDATGRRVLYQAVRLEPGYGGKDKHFYRRRPHPCGRGWIDNLDGVELVLYRLPEIVCAKPHVPVLVVAGEKDADNLRALGLVATTNLGGESARWLDGYSQTLSGRHVVVIEDRDTAGGRHADEVCGSLMRCARSIRRGAMPEKDATAFLCALRRNNVHTPAELREYVGAAIEGFPKWETV